MNQETREENLVIKKAVEDLSIANFDFSKAEEISEKISAIHIEYGDCPEYALTSIAAGYNAKCMAELGAEHAVNHPLTKDLKGVIDAGEYNKTTRVNFDLVNELAASHEELFHEVLYAWNI